MSCLPGPAVEVAEQETKVLVSDMYMDSFVDSMLKLG